VPYTFLSFWGPQLCVSLSMLSLNTQNYPIFVSPKVGFSSCFANWWPYFKRKVPHCSYFKEGMMGWVWAYNTILNSKSGPLTK